MEKANIVSIWSGRFGSEDELVDFVQDRYSEDGDLIPSTFMSAFGIAYIDYDFQEVLFEDGLTKEYLLQASYAKSFIGKVFDKLPAENSLILLYDFDYTGKKQKAENLRFIGSFGYVKE